MRIEIKIEKGLRKDGKDKIKGKNVMKRLDEIVGEVELFWRKRIKRRIIKRGIWKIGEGKEIGIKIEKMEDEKKKKKEVEWNIEKRIDGVIKIIKGSWEKELDIMKIGKRVLMKIFKCENIGRREDEKGRILRIEEEIEMILEKKINVEGIERKKMEDELKRMRREDKKEGEEE